MAVPPDFVSGQVLTAAQMNKIGLWFIKSQTIGTGVSTVTVSDAFSADYTHYKIILMGGVASTDITLRMTLGATATGYYYGGTGSSFAGVAQNSSAANVAYWVVGAGNTTMLGTNIELFNPQIADETAITFDYLVGNTTGAYIRGGGFLNNTTQYTAFTIVPSTGTFTGGTIFVYGYRD